MALGVLLHRAAVLECFVAHGAGVIGLARMRLRENEIKFQFQINFHCFLFPFS